MPAQNPAATAIKKVLDAPAPYPSSQWRALPGFTFGLPRTGSDDEAFGRSFIDTMMRLYAMAVRHEFQAAKDVAQFVALCQLSWSDDRLSFTGFAPREGIKTFVQQSIASKQAMAKLPALLDSFDGKMVRRCAFPAEVWVPLAVVYTPADGQILFSNINQLESPAQFLNPAYCTTTSGFLNYLGSLLLQTSITPNQRIQVKDVHHLVGQGVDPFIRWIHHAIASGSIFDSNRIFVKTADPEQYDFKYS
jgi:hypothetical protein